ncbi:hypothetical protein [Bradyrhizobium sp. USDA 241]
MNYWLITLALLIGANWIASAIIDSTDELNNTIERLVQELIGDEEEE